MILICHRLATQQSFYSLVVLAFISLSMATQPGMAEAGPTDAGKALAKGETDSESKTILSELRSIEEMVKELKQQGNAWHNSVVIAALVAALIAMISGVLNAKYTARLSNEARKDLVRLENELSTTANAKIVKLEDKLSTEALHEARLQQHLFDSLQNFKGHTRP